MTEESPPPTGDQSGGPEAVEISLAELAESGLGFGVLDEMLPDQENPSADDVFGGIRDRLGMNWGCLGVFAMVLAFIGVGIVLAGSLFDGDSSDADAITGGDATASGGEPAASDGAPAATPPESESEFEDVFNGGGQLVPISGIWDISNGAGVDTCLGDIALDVNLQRVQLEVVDGGETLRVRELMADGELGPVFEFERESGNELEAVYYADFSDQTERASERWVTFGSSYTMGADIEGCANRGADGWLVEPAG